MFRTVSSLRLGPTSYVVLGSIAVRGPSTSYDLKRFVELTLGHFWSFPHSQLYAEPDRLARAGLLTEDREEGGRRRRTYAITNDGRRVLDAWLHEPATAQVELRHPGLLKLFFSELADDDAVPRARPGAGGCPPRDARPLRMAHAALRRPARVRPSHGSAERRVRDGAGPDRVLGRGRRGALGARP